MAETYPFTTTHISIVLKKDESVYLSESLNYDKAYEIAIGNIFIENASKETLMDLRKQISNLIGE